MHALIMHLGGAIYITLQWGLDELFQSGNAPKGNFLSGVRTNHLLIHEEIQVDTFYLQSSGTTNLLYKGKFTD